MIVKVHINFLSFLITFYSNKNLTAKCFLINTELESKLFKNDVFSLKNIFLIFFIIKF